MKLLNRFSTWIFFVAVLSLSACNDSGQEICQRQLPEAEKEISDALQTLDPYHWVDAPVPNPMASFVPVSQSSNRKWHEWSMTQLRLTQKYADLLNPLPGLDKAEVELSNAAKKWVEFYSYAKQENRVKMVRVLRVIQEHLIKTKGIACNEMGQLTAPTESLQKK